ncbi:PWI domain-containing protein [Besnoitia besnoiti]|uniref:PWI domain-containing protein n=1 Tax=Besnoitia besnoiti TaxID=94643 RepID=A0A2A9MCL2_BESBE|nr:PWI domain-containing protein [Besnoitia besnoiti]PFH35725.1 PWI domain-containing protein [Besnoitia besnoiti]
MHPGGLPVMPGGGVPPPGLTNFGRPAVPGAPPLLQPFGLPPMPSLGMLPASPAPSLLMPPRGAGAPGAFFQPSGSLSSRASQSAALQPADKAEESKAATVYVGNIHRRADNDFMRILLSECGRVVRWNRQADPTTGQLAAFGFCDFHDPVGALNALEVLPELVIGGKALKVNCNDKVRAEINRVREDRVLSTMHTFRDKTREEVEKEIEEETSRLRSAVMEIVKRKEAQMRKSGREEKSSRGRRDESKERGSKKASSRACVVFARVGIPVFFPARIIVRFCPRFFSGDADSRASSRRASADNGKAASPPEPAAPLPANAPPGPPGKEGDATSVVAAAGGIGTFAGLNALKQLDPELAEAASSCSVYRVGPDGKDRRGYISEDYRPCRRELERLHHLERRDAEFDREFRRREAEWIAREEEFIRNREKELELEQEIRDSDRQQLINEDLRGEWWDGLEDPRRRQERKRRRKREAEDDAFDRDEEEKEQREEERKRREEKKRNQSRQEAGDSDARSGSLQREREREKERARERERERERKEREESSRSASSSSSSRHVEKKMPASSPSSGDRAAEATQAKGGKAKEETGRDAENRDRKEKKDSRRIKAELRTSLAQQPSSQVLAFFNDEDGVFDGEKRKHRPLTKLDHHRDATNRMQKAQETLKVIEHSKKILASVPTEKSKLFAFNIDWSLLISKNILEIKLRPWVRKKVCEFMGAEESLVLEVIDYIIKRVSDRPQAEELLGELAKFLDEEAEGFVRNMWRLLIYEQLKLAQPPSP